MLHFLKIVHLVRHVSRCYQTVRGGLDRAPFGLSEGGATEGQGPVELGTGGIAPSAAGPAQVLGPEPSAQNGGNACDKLLRIRTIPYLARGARYSNVDAASS